MLTPSEDTITVKDWLTDYSIGKSAQYSRKLVLRLYVETNGKTLPNNPTSEQIVEAAEQVIEDIKSGKVKLYSTARRFVETISKRMLPSSVNLYQSMLPGLFKATLGEPNFSHTVFDGPAGAPWHTNYVTTEKKVPDINHFKEMLRRGSIRDR